MKLIEARRFRRASCLTATLIVGVGGAHLRGVICQVPYAWKTMAENAEQAMSDDETPGVRPLFAWLWLLPVTLFGYLTVVAPWPVADRALRDLGDGPRIVVAMSYQRGANHSIRRQTYLMFPDALRTFRAHEVIEENDATRVEPLAFGAMIYGALYGCWFGASAWYLLRRKTIGRERR